MKRVYVLTGIFLLAMSIRIFILSQTGISLEAYRHLIQIAHIQETGLPLLYDTLVYSGSYYAVFPLYYYLSALVAIFIPEVFAAVLITTLAGAGIPLVLYYITKEFTAKEYLCVLLSLVSLFVPLLYATTVQPGPLSLAIFLLLLAYYFFLRLSQTPKDQKKFVLVTIALVLTSPYSLFLAMALLGTIVASKIQRIPIYRTAVEAALFVTFTSVWANMLVYKQQLQQLGLHLFFAQERISFSFLEQTTYIGVFILITGMYGVYLFVTQQNNQRAIALIVFLLLAGIFILVQLVSQTELLLLISLVFIPLSTATIHVFIQSKKQSRIPYVHTLFVLFIAALFLITSALPAFVLAQYDTPTEQELKLIQELRVFEGETVYWDERFSWILRQNGIGSPIAPQNYLHPLALEKKIALEEITTTRSPVRLIELLNMHNIQGIVLPKNHTVVITETCFQRIQTEYKEVYRVLCVIE